MFVLYTTSHRDRQIESERDEIVSTLLALSLTLGSKDKPDCLFLCFIEEVLQGTVKVPSFIPCGETT